MYYDGTIDLWVDPNGEDADELFLRVRRTVLVIMKERWPLLKFQERVACYQCSPASVNWFKIEALGGSACLHCTECGQDLSREQLRGDFFSSLPQLLEEQPRIKKQQLREAFVNSPQWDTIEMPLFSFLGPAICEDPGDWHQVKDPEEAHLFTFVKLRHIPKSHLSRDDALLAAEYFCRASDSPSLPGVLEARKSIQAGRIELCYQSNMYRIRVDDSRRQRWLCYDHACACLRARRDPKATLSPIELAVALRWEQEGEAETVLVNTQHMGKTGQEHFLRAQAAFTRLQHQQFIFEVTSVEVVLNQRRQAGFDHRCFQIMQARQATSIGDVKKLLFYQPGREEHLRSICNDGFRLAKRTNPKHLFGIGHYFASQDPAYTLWWNDNNAWMNLTKRLENQKVLAAWVATGLSKRVSQSMNGRACHCDSPCGGPEDHDSHESPEGNEVMVRLDDQTLPAYVVTFAIVPRRSFPDPDLGKVT